MENSELYQDDKKDSWMSRAEEREIVTRDGIHLFYEMVGEGKETIVLANGLGGRLYSWEPLVEALASRYRLISWDYRGLFESDAPRHIRRLAIPEHTEDIREILRHENIPTATFAGWSMGVQVVLEMASLYPECVERLILLNGTYGKVLQTAYQPVFRLTWMNRVIHEALDYMVDHSDLTDALGRQILAMEMPLRTLGRLWGKLYRSQRMEGMLWRYIKDVFETDFGNYLRLFQELDAHSTYHLLRDLKQPTLIISGLLDVLTPAYLSHEMARKIPNSEHVMIPFGSHFVLAEFPDKLNQIIDRFLRE